MLEKMAEAIREEWFDPQFAYIPCPACVHGPIGSDACMVHRHGRIDPKPYEEQLYIRECPHPGEPEGSLMLARWAVKQAALALAEELSEYEGYREQSKEAALAKAHDAAVFYSRCADGASGALGRSFAALVKEARE